MAKEIELKLGLPSRAVKLLLAQPLLHGLEARRQRLHNTYFDTPDLTLKAVQIELRQRRIGQRLLQTVKSGDPLAGGLASRSEWEEPTEPGHFDFSKIDDKRLRQHLERNCDHLQPIFTTEFIRITWQVRAHADSLIEVALDRGVIESRGKKAHICEVELELKEGHAGDLFELAHQLQQTLALHPAVVGKAERGYALWKDEASSSPLKAKPPALEPDMSPLSAFRAIALACLRHLQGNEEGVRATNEPEYIHQMRVAVRRLRLALKLFAPVLPPGFVEHWDPRWRDLGSQLGQARNWDIFATESLPPLISIFPDSTEVRQLAKACERQRSAYRKAVRSSIAADGHSRLLLEFSATLYSSALEDEGASTAKDALIGFAAQRLARLAKRAKARAKRVHSLDASKRHRMRIAFKKLRYALEFFAPLLPTRRIQPYINELEKLQNALGELNDLAVAQQLIASVSGVKADGLAAGWMAARQGLLLRALPKKLDRFLQIRSPWH